MKLTIISQVIKRLALTSLLTISSPISFAEDGDVPATDPTSAAQEAQNLLQQISTYFKNMGMYFGYDLTDYCSTGGSCSSSNGGSSSTGGGSGGFSNQLINSTSAYSSEIDLITSFLGALMPSVNQQSANNANTSGINFELVPSTNIALSSYAAIINSYGGQAFSGQETAYNSEGSGAFSVSPLIDQQPYQTGPVNQALLNILATPDVSFCLNGSGVPYTPCNTGTVPGPNNSLQANPNLGGGPVLSQVQVMLNTLGTFPSGDSAVSKYPAPGFYALPAQNTALVPQLNSDILLGPLMFNNQGNQQNNGSSSANTSNNPQYGLTASNQIEQAANYIRYASGAVSPLTQPNKSQYAMLYLKAVNNNGSYTQQEQFTAQSILASYLTNLRIYAAQTSVGISNLYYILSRRMPQKSQAGGASNQKTSQALSEYVMATWRLQPPANNDTGSQTWTNQINNASSATVQKEIAILLAEINYQLYLSRIQQERLLLTNSTMLLQSARNVQPSANLNRSPAAEIENGSTSSQ